MTRAHTKPMPAARAACLALRVPPPVEAPVQAAPNASAHWSECVANGAAHIVAMPRWLSLTINNKHPSPSASGNVWAPPDAFSDLRQLLITGRLPVLIANDRCRSPKCNW